MRLLYTRYTVRPLARFFLFRSVIALSHPLKVVALIAPVNDNSLIRGDNKVPFHNYSPEFSCRRAVARFAKRHLLCREACTQSKWSSRRLPHALRRGHSDFL